MGSFLFFFALARWLGAERFGLFMAVWVGVQVLEGIATAWIYLPLTSMVIREVQDHLFYGACLSRLRRILMAVPVLLPMAWCISAPRVLKTPSLMCLGVCLCAVTIAVMFLRCYFIRRGYRLSSAALVMTKWAVAIALAYWSVQYKTISVQRAMRCLLAGSTLALTVSVLVILRFRINVTLNADPGISRRLTSFSRPLLFQAVSGAFSALLTTFAMCTWVSTAAYGAYQALRSICNILSPLMQMISTHYSSYLARQDSLKSPIPLGFLVIVLSAPLVIVVWLARDSFVRTTIGAGYLPYAGLLPLVLLHTVVVLANSIMAARVRRLGDTTVFYHYGLVGLGGSVALIPIAAVTCCLQGMIWVIILVAIIQLLLLRFAQRSRGPERKVICAV